jgi:A/G-specific adenine glycosylase
MDFTEEILNWYTENKRPLPWRNTRDPYKIWLSEVILQQTRVAQGLPYYKEFLSQFPTVHALAGASEKKVLKLWQGLGYYSRARNMHGTAKRVSGELGGVFPSSYKGLLSLKGVGDYTASAIASICFDAPLPVVDGNVFRVLSRYFGVDVPVNTSGGSRYFKGLAAEVMEVSQPGEYNQAIMEFGARQCTPRNPVCAACPLSGSCVALHQDRVTQLPVKNKRSGVRKRYFNYLVPIDTEDRTLLRQRVGKGIWQQLYEFPLFEAPAIVAEDQIRDWMPSAWNGASELQLHPVNGGEIVHKLSHQHLHTRFWIIRINGRLEGGIAPGELDSYPVPVLIADFIKTLKNSYF